MTTNNAVNSSPALPQSGGTMTGSLILNSDPTSSLQAATKQYILDLGGFAPEVGAISGNWYTCGTLFNNVVGSNGFSMVANNVYYYPFYVTKGSTYVSIGILCGSVVLGTSVLGIYNDSGALKPTGNPITNSNSTDLTNIISTFISFNFPSAITLTKGIYWLACGVSANTTIIGPGGGPLAAPTGLGSTTNTGWVTATANQNGWTEAFAYSSTLPTVGALTATVGYTPASSTNIYIFLQAQ